MIELHADQLWLGNRGDLLGPRSLFDAGIEAVVDLALEEPVAHLPRELIYCRIPILDGDGNDPERILLAMRCLAGFLASETRTMVACSAGMSRSPAIAAGALAVHLNQAPETVLSQIAALKALEVNDALWNDVVASVGRFGRPAEGRPDFG